jgi:hypothetical protein
MSALRRQIENLQLCNKLDSRLDPAVNWFMVSSVLSRQLQKALDTHLNPRHELVLPPHRVLLVRIYTGPHEHPLVGPAEGNLANDAARGVQS